MVTSEQYSKTADKLTKRILKLIPKNLKILEMNTPWELFKLSDFNYEDLGPTMFQADWALNNAKHLYNDIYDGVK
jgi:hypothetical protein